MKELVAWHEKDAARSDVYIHDLKQPGDVPVVTRYRVVQIFSGAGPEREAVAELEVELVTGRTHQIRAHFAHLGHPLLGDGKYGRNAYNRHFRTPAGAALKRQQLWATSISFAPDCPPPCMALAGSTESIDPDYDVILAGKADS
jgi:23S rRNA pseudouridine955/2504/2580 synthase